MLYSNFRRIVAPVVLMLIACMVTTFPARHAAGTTLSADARALVQAADGAPGDNFGHAVAIDGDLMAVGASAADVNGVNGAGAVYLFRRDTDAPTGWIAFKKLTVALPEVNELYGANVALDGDVLAVGATARNAGANSDVGVVYLYERNQGGADTWGLRTTLSEPLGGFASYGSAVALDGDLLLVGAKGAFQQRGAAYLYDRRADWGKIKEFRDGDGVTADYFGETVAIDGDTIVVGQPMYTLSSRADNSGAAFVFGRDQEGLNTWGKVARLVADSAEANSRFGSAVALDGATIVVGASNASSGGNTPVERTGAAFVFERDRGGANGWGIVKRLVATGGASGDFYGAAVALAGNDLWVGAAFSDASGFNAQGIVYRYGRDQGGAGAWGETAGLEAEDGLAGDQFGSAIAVYGATAVVGAVGHLDSRGAVYVPGQDAPAPPSMRRIYLPQISATRFISTGVLRDGGSVEATSGARVGAVPGTFTDDVEVLIETAPPPAVSLGDSVTPVGDYHVIAAARRVTTPIDKPLLIGLPVLDGANPDNMALAMLLPPSQHGEGRSRHTWTSMPGRFDAVNNLFVATIPLLPSNIVHVVLIEHPSLDPLPLPPTARTVANVDMAAQPAQTPPLFVVTCEPFMPFAACNQQDQDDLAADVARAYADFVGTHRFREPRLVRSIGFFRGTNGQPALIPTTAFHGVVIEVPPCVLPAGPYAGFYEQETATLHVCLDPGWTSDVIKATVRHELFHAIQASYPKMFEDMVGNDRERADWTIEGTAATAELSSSSMRVSSAFPAHTISDSLVDTADVHAYSAQDFWVYTGEELGVNLSYLRAIFEAGGTPEDVATALNLGDAYWRWAKNQAFEKERRIHPGMQEPACTIEPTLTGAHSIENWPGTVRSTGSLLPLTSAVIEINFTDTMEIGNLSATSSGGDDVVRYKPYYRGNSVDCTLTPEGEQNLGLILRGSKMYVLVANTSPSDTHTYTVILQGAG
ncbi:MAG: FG-GAP repeat protein [Roseiflexaceae bacterium]|nr:FG-GAP repeat protein [Roseiflexaceae bacterium]